jgi:hypothetical protein
MYALFLFLFNKTGGEEKYYLYLEIEKDNLTNFNNFFFLQIKNGLDYWHK